MEDDGILYGNLVYIYYGHFIYTMPIRYIDVNLVYFSRFGMLYIPRKIWQPFCRHNLNSLMSRLELINLARQPLLICLTKGGGFFRRHYFRHY
jgi:hypothetical protein